jgi:two-component system chemotaxis sensor kinase CheA
MERQVRTLREAVMRARLAPLSEVFLRMPLAVRDLGRSTGKVIQLMIEGGETEIDKALLDRLIDPLMHMVRNAVAHGIEAPAARAAAGKPAEGAIHLRGRTEGEHVIITVEDDGGGITVEQVRAKAKALGWLEDDRPLTNQDLLELLCRPGFSTQESADMGAGRGMGMNAAAEAIAEMGGTLALDTHPGQGARFTIQLPLTLTIIDAFIVEAGGERFAVPQSAVNEVIEVVPAQITRAVKHDLLPYRGGAIPLVSLHHVFGLPRPPAARWLGLVTGANDRQAALLVDQVLGLRETVVRPLADPLVAEPGISGATELGDGSVVLILNCHELIHHYRAARGWAGAA